MLLSHSSAPGRLMGGQGRAIVDAMVRPASTQLRAALAVNGAAIDIHAKW
jgi:hypothetical protein